ncbi:hypothetical protein [Desulforhopalus sp. 52FAK]
MQITILSLLSLVFAAAAGVLHAETTYDLICGTDLGVLSKAGPRVMPQSSVYPLINQIDSSKGANSEDEAKRIIEANIIQDVGVFISSKLDDANCIVIARGDFVQNIETGERDLQSANLQAIEYGRNTIELDKDYSLPSFEFTDVVNDYLHSPTGTENRKNLESFRKKFGFPASTSQQQ